MPKQGITKLIQQILKEWILHARRGCLCYCAACRLLKSPWLLTKKRFSALVIKWWTKQTNPCPNRAPISMEDADTLAGYYATACGMLSLWKALGTQRTLMQVEAAWEESSQADSRGWVGFRQTPRQNAGNGVFQTEGMRLAKTQKCCWAWYFQGSECISFQLDHQE